MKTLFLSLVLFATNSFAINYLAVSGDEYNSTARVVLTRNGNFYGFCSGVLIAPSVVLSARHCAELNDIEFIILGTGGDHEALEVDRVSTIDMPRSILNMYSESGELVYNSQVSESDYLVATGKDLLIIHLKTASRFRPAQIIPGTLYSFLQTAPLHFAGYPAMASGISEESMWGIRIPTPVSTFTNCFYDNFNTRDLLLVTDCIALPGQSGGPLFATLGGQNYLVGIFSFGSSISQQVEIISGRNFANTYTINLTNNSILSFINRSLH